MNFSVTGQPVLQIGVVSADVDGRFSLVKPNICYFSCLVSLVFIVTTHNSCQNVHIIKNRAGKPGLPGFMPRYTGTAKRTTHVNATRKNAAFWGSTLHLGPMA